MNNFKYSVELMQKMSEILKPDILSIMDNDLKRNQVKPLENIVAKRDLMTGVLVTVIAKDGPVTKEIDTGSGKWITVFHSVNEHIVMSVCELETGTAFRYDVNTFEDKDFSNVVNYIHMICEKNEEKEKQKQQENE